MEQATITAISEAVAAAMKAQTAVASGNNFDFKAFNALVNNTQPGLKLALAENLLKDAIKGFQRYNNPMTNDLLGIGEELTTFRIKYKEEAAKRNQGNLQLQVTKAEVEQRVANSK